MQSLLLGLLEKNPIKRLGAGGAEEVKTQPWFKNVDWDLMLEKKISAPFIPFMKEAGDTRNFEKVIYLCRIIF